MVNTPPALSRFSGVRLWQAVLPWIVALIAAAVLLWRRPFTSDLDRGSIFAIAGFILAILAVTFGLVAVLGQHLAETVGEQE